LEVDQFVLYASEAVLQQDIAPCAHDCQAVARCQTS